MQVKGSMCIWDLLNSDFFEGWAIFGLFWQLKNITLSNGNKWLIDIVLEERNIDLMGSNWFYSLKLVSNKHVMNFNIWPQCFHHTQFCCQFLWFGLIPHQVSCRMIVWTKKNCIKVFSDAVFILNCLKLAKLLFRWWKLRQITDKVEEVSN